MFTQGQLLPCRARQIEIVDRKNGDADAGRCDGTRDVRARGALAAALAAAHTDHQWFSRAVRGKACADGGFEPLRRR
jgi:hypothetical protein